MIDITSDLKELNISYDKINVVRQGENSDTFLITTSKNKLIAKKFKNLNFQTITNTYLNKKILNQLVDKKLFPKVVYQSEEKDFLIYEYVESIKSNKDKLFYKNLGMKIREIHEIKPCKNNLTFEQQLNFYKMSLGKVNKEKVYTRIEDLLNDINIKKSKLVFSHNDLNANNILYNKDICIIDYEYSSLNNKFCDLSKVIFEFQMTEEEIESLLKGYRINFDDVTKKKIILWQRFNLYLDYIWSIIISSNENQLTKENIESFYLNKYIDFDLKN